MVTPSPPMGSSGDTALQLLSQAEAAVQEGAFFQAAALVEMSGKIVEVAKQDDSLVRCMDKAEMMLRAIHRAQLTSLPPEPPAHRMEASDMDLCGTGDRPPQPELSQPIGKTEADLDVGMARFAEAVREDRQRHYRRAHAYYLSAFEHFHSGLAKYPQGVLRRAVTVRSAQCLSRTEQLERVLHGAPDVPASACPCPAFSLCTGTTLSVPSTGSAEVAVAATVASRVDSLSLSDSDAAADDTRDATEAVSAASGPGTVQAADDTAPGPTAVPSPAAMAPAVMVRPSTATSCASPWLRATEPAAVAAPHLASSDCPAAGTTLQTSGLALSQQGGDAATGVLCCPSGASATEEEAVVLSLSFHRDDSAAADAPAHEGLCQASPPLPAPPPHPPAAAAALLSPSPTPECPPPRPWLDTLLLRASALPGPCMVPMQQAVLALKLAMEADCMARISRALPLYYTTQELLDQVLQVLDRTEDLELRARLSTCQQTVLTRAKWLESHRDQP